MNMPLIGLTPSHDVKAEGLALRSNYCNAIRQAGGIPVVLPLELTDEEMDALSGTLDGVLFCGGPDIHPFLFGEEALMGCGDMSLLRDRLELSFFKHMYHKNKPILGICRGMQLINIALGGTIYQDIPSQYHAEPRLAHLQPKPYITAAHRVRVPENTLLFQICGSGLLEVNSMHHQAVKEPASMLTVCGSASDGLIEALEMPDYPFLLGVQWHPEFLYPEYAHAESLFRSFVSACHS